jgi:hypothetical protein
MSNAEERARKKRRRLIERLNETEELLGPQDSIRHGQMSEEELEAEIERQRTLNALRGAPVGVRLLASNPSLFTRVPRRLNSRTFAGG